MKKLIVLLFSPYYLQLVTTQPQLLQTQKILRKWIPVLRKWMVAPPDNGNVELVYTMKYVSDWVPGDPHHAAMVMKALKGCETGNINDTKQYFADSVAFIGDGYKFKGTRDSLMSEFNKDRAEYKEVAIAMHDWESVKSKSRGEEYVTMWYMQKSTDMKGRKDSANYTDDVKIVNGKIAQIDSKVQHFPKGKM